jgi:CubicO group peptidase (beta-lactamase class C family)
MKKLLIAILMTAALLQSVFADNEQAASRFVEYWNLGEGRDVRNESVFSKDFIDRRGPDGLAMIMNMVYGDNGEISIHSITESSDQRIVFAASAQKGNWMEIALDVSADFRVAGMSIQLVPQPPEGTDKGLSEAQIVSKLEQYLGKRAAAGDFSGSVLLARKGDILFAQAYGLADREKGLENTLDTPINLGSMNKMFTGLAVAQLVTGDKLAYTDTVGKYLPDYPNAKVRDEVTVHQLLTHTSGLGSYWNDAYLRLKDSLRSVSDFAALCAEEPLGFEPGSKFLYSNCGPVVLGLIIEAVTGQDYYDYIRAHVYAPAGMENSDHFNKVETDSGKATGYFVPQASGATELISNFDDLGYIGSPAGGGYASANDLLRFATALYDGSLIDGQHREEMTTYKIQQGADEGYAYLYGDARVNGRRYIGHNGGAPGINAEFSVFPDSGYTLVVLSNTGSNASPVANQVRQWIGFQQWVEQSERERGE